MTDKNRPPGGANEHSEPNTGEGLPPLRTLKRPQHRPQIPLPFVSGPGSPVVSDRDQLHALLSSLPGILFVLNRHATLTMLEGKGANLLAPSKQLLVGRSFFELYPDNVETRKHLGTAFDGTANSWTGHIGEHVFVTTLTPLRNHEDVVTGLLGVGIITSDMIPAGASPESGPQSTAGVPLPRKQLFAQVSHELRSPLNSIVSFANLLLENKESHLDKHDLFYIERITGNATHLLGVVEDMMDLGAIETGKAKLALVEVDLAELIRETIAEIGGTKGSDAIELRTKIPDDARPLETDRLKLKQILINLLSNALKYTRKGSVTVSFGVDEFLRPFRIDVRDTGIGIPTDNLESIFDAYERGDHEGDRKIEGTGLGLAVTRALCQLLGYSIRVASKPGKGSTFTIDFSHTA